MAKDIILEDDLIRRKKIPALILDKEWKSLFEGNMTKTMKKNAQELEEKISEEKKAMMQLRVLKKLKKQLMEKILILSDEVNSGEKESSLHKLEETKKQILEANQQIDDLEYRMEILPKEIEKLNLMLLKETIQIAYTDIKEGSHKILTLTEDITQLRQQLHEKWEEKFNCEKRAETLYSYLHNTLGHEETNKLDKRFL